MFSPRARRFWDSMLNPMPETNRDKSIITQTVLALGGVGVSPPSHWRYRQVSIDEGESLRIDLTDREQHMWALKFADYVYATGVHEYVQSPEFVNQTAGVQRKLLGELLQEAKDKSFEELTKKDPRGRKLFDKIQDAKEARAKSVLRDTMIPSRYMPPEYKQKQALREFIQQ